AGFEESGMSWLEYGKQFELTAEEALMFEKQRAETYEKEFQNWINPPTKNFEGGYVDKQKLSEFYRNTPFGKNDNFEDYKRAAFDYAYTGFFSAVVEEAEKEMPDLSKKTTIEPQQALEELAGETENASYSVKEFNADILEALSILSGVTFDYSENSPAVVGKEIGDTIFEKARKKMDGLTQVSPDEAQKVADSVMKTVQKVFPKKQQGFITAGNGTDYIDVYAYVRESIDTLSNTMANTDLSGASVADLSETYSRLSGLLSHYDGENFSWRDNPEQFKRELAASVGNSVLPDDIRTMFLSIMDNATTDADLAKMTAEAITTQISQSGILEREESASSAQSNKPKPDWDFYRQFIGAEEKRWYAQYEQAIRTQMVENGAFVDESGQFDYVAFQKAASAKPDSKEGKAWTEEWTKAVQSLIEAVENGEKVSGFQVYDYAGQYDMYSPLLGQRLNDIYVQIGETIGSFSDITSENFADAVSFITDSQAWQNFAENAMFKSDLDPEATAKEMFTLLEKIGANPEWVQEFKTDTLTELSTLTPDKQLEMIQTLIRGVDNAIDLANGDNTEALKRIETVVAGKTTSGGTTTGQMTMNEIVQNWDKAKASGNKETMKMYEIMLDSAIGSLYYDDNDDSKSGFIGQLKDLNGVPKLTAAQILDEGVGGAGWKTLMNIASNGFFSDAYFKENFNQQYGLHLKWIEDNLKRQEEVEKTVAELGEGAGLQTTPENKSKGMLSLLFGDDFDLSELGAQLFAGLSESLTTLNDNLNPETVELLTTLANFSFDDTQLENWQSFATAIDMVGTALNAMKEAFGMADEGMQTDAMGGGMMTAEGGGGLLGMLQQLIGMEIDTTQWEAFAEVVQMVADAFDTINTALTGGGEEMEGAEGAASAGLLQSLQAMNQIITDFPLTLETFCEYLASDLPEAAALAKAALGEVTIDEEGNTKAGEGNTLYTSVGAIYGLFQDINATLLTFIGILKERIPATVRAFQPIVGEFVGMAEEIAAAGYGVADAWNAAAAAIQLAMQAIDDAKGKDWTVPSVGGGDGGGGGGGVFAAGGTSGFRYVTAIVGEHGPELVTNNGSRAWTVFSNSHLMGEIAHTRHALNMLSNSAEMVAYNRLMGSGSSNTTTDNSQHFENHFGAVIGDDAFRSMVDDEVRRVWRREMRLAS
ncbi:MAG: hypothetical protein J6W04_00095, partial [Bacteroidales bacterium]|nr:hypothetical protein [Bacteroidales bacterium]